MSLPLITDWQFYAFAIPAVLQPYLGGLKVIEAKRLKAA